MNFDLVRLPGDVDIDGLLTVADALLVASHILQGVPLTAAQMVTADYDRYGVVTIINAQLIYYAIE